ncbi:MAG: hypothetical protein L7U72_07140, partial [Rubripirellula sp.]|nr:hypothetical protein [Rubripirellula sp.]
ADRPYLVLRERESERQGVLRECLTVFLTASTCPIGCKMCDLHHHTLPTQTPPGAIPRQIDEAMRLEDGGGSKVDWIKLYNSGNFFDPRSIPPSDYEEIASRIGSYQRVIIENHPKFGQRRLEQFQSLLDSKLEIAVGLETVQPRWLMRLEKQMTRDDFDHYARLLRKRSIDLRVFIIVGTPGLTAREAVRWAALSVRHAALQGARHISLIPARGTTSALSPSAIEGTPSSKRLGESRLVEPNDLQKGSSRNFPPDMNSWGTALGPLPSIRPEDLLDLQQQSIRWSSSEVVITVDPWDLGEKDDTVEAIKRLNISQMV